jgi:hypothetical protein
MWFVVTLVASGSSLRTVHAQSVTSLDSDLFAPGTDVSNAFSGVTLQAMSLVPDPNIPPVPFTTWMPSYSPIYAAAGNFFSSSPTENSGFGLFFEPLDSSGTGDCFQQCTGGQGSFFGTNLLVSISTSVNQVSVSQIGNSANGVAIEAFNSSDQEVGYCAATPGGIPQAPGTYACSGTTQPGPGSYTVISGGNGGSDWQVSTSISAPGISKVLIGAFNNTGDQVNTIRFFGAPEIDPISSVSALTLLLGGLMILRGKRPMKRDSAAA